MLRRAAYSPNIKERADCSAALFTAAGELLVQAEHIPVHLGSMPAAVAAAIAAVGGAPRPGDQIVLNDPFAGGTHLNDVTLVVAVLRARRAGRVGGEPRPPRRPRRDGAGLDAARSDRDLPGGPAHPAGAPRRRRGARSWSRARARPPSAPATSTRSAAPTAIGVERIARHRRTRSGRRGAARRDRRLRRAAHAGGAGRPARRRVALRGRARLGRARARAADADAHRVDADDRRRRARRSTSPVPTRSAPGNVNAVEAVTVSAVAFAVRAATDPTIPANGGAMRPGAA